MDVHIRIKELLSSVYNKHISQLVSLDVSNNNLGPDAIEALSSFFSSSRSLKILKMNNCGLYPRTGKRLQEAFV